MCSKAEALLKIDAKQLDSLLHPQFDAKALKAAVPVANGLAASPGAACGGVYFTAEDAKEAAKLGPVLLVRNETSPEDIEGMSAAQGILTAPGGRTSPAAVVARGMGTCCVAGCGAVRLNEEGKYLTIGENRVNEGNSCPSTAPPATCISEKSPPWRPPSPETRHRHGLGGRDPGLKVRTNADTPRDAEAPCASARRASA